MNRDSRIVCMVLAFGFALLMAIASANSTNLGAAGFAGWLSGAAFVAGIAAAGT